jgi:fumarylacetoacetase
MSCVADEKHCDVAAFNIADVEMQLPVLIGDYTDFSF